MVKAAIVVRIRKVSSFFLQSYTRTDHQSSGSGTTAIQSRETQVTLEGGSLSPTSKHAMY